jgi:hypothetical protein
VVGHVRDPWEIPKRPLHWLSYSLVVFRSANNLSPSGTWSPICGPCAPNCILHGYGALPLQIFFWVCLERHENRVSRCRRLVISVGVTRFLPLVVSVPQKLSVVVMISIAYYRIE